MSAAGKSARPPLVPRQNSVRIERIELSLSSHSEPASRGAHWGWVKWAEGVFDVDWDGLAQEVSLRERSPIVVRARQKGGHLELSAVRPLSCCPDSRA